MPTIPLNSKPLGYRIGNSDRVLGQPSNTEDGFVVLNQSSGSAFQSSAGVWATLGSFPAYLLDAWFATIVGVPVNGYRIGNTNRVIGATATEPNGFFVINLTNSKVFQVVSNLWADVTGSFSGTTLTNILAAWRAA